MRSMAVAHTVVKIPLRKFPDPDPDPEYRQNLP